LSGNKRLRLLQLALVPAETISSPFFSNPATDVSHLFIELHTDFVDFPPFCGLQLAVDVLT